MFIFLFSFRLFCQHLTHLPEIRSYAVYNGQDPCPWSFSNSALLRLWVRHPFCTFHFSEILYLFRLLLKMLRMYLNSVLVDVQAGSHKNDSNHVTEVFSSGKCN